MDLTLYATIESNNTFTISVFFKNNSLHNKLCEFVSLELVEN